MKIEVLKENFRNGLNIVEKITGKNLSLPILNNILISGENNLLNLNSTDLETAIRLWILAKVTKNGKIIIPAKLISNFISSLTDEKLLLEVKGFNIEIKCRGLKTQIQGQNPEEFPIIPEFKNTEVLEIDSKSFCQGLNQVTDISSLSQIRPEISGVYFLFSDNLIKIVATDSFRLAEKSISLKTKPNKNYSFILPLKSVKELINILGEKEGLLKIYFSQNQVMFEFPMKEISHPQFQIISRLIEGEYPNYQDIIPKKFKTRVILKRDEFLNQVKTISLFSGKINEIKLTVSNNSEEIKIFAKDPDIGESESTIPAKIEGDPIEISFNHKFLTDGLLKIKSSEIYFDLSKEEGPCVLKPVGDASYIYVVMPIKSTS